MLLWYTKLSLSFLIKIDKKKLYLKANSWTIFYWALGNIICLSQRQRQIKCINHKSGINWKSVSAQIVDFGTVLQGVSVARQVCACVWGVQLSRINEPALGKGLLLYNEAYLPLFFVFVTKIIYHSALYDSYIWSWSLPAQEAQQEILIRGLQFLLLVSMNLFFLRPPNILIRVKMHNMLNTLPVHTPDVEYPVQDWRNRKARAHARSTWLNQSSPKAAQHPLKQRPSL